MVNITTGFLRIQRISLVIKLCPSREIVQALMPSPFAEFIAKEFFLFLSFLQFYNLLIIN